MHYRVQHKWPVLSIVIDGGTIIDTAQPHQNFLQGVIPPPDSTPLDQATRDWLVAAYSRDEGYPEIAPVGTLK
jgi:hypothetical protein